MATLTYAYKNTRFLFVALLTSVLTAIVLQRFGPALVLILCLLPWLIILFYFYPLYLLSVWHVLSIFLVIFSDFSLTVGSISFLPLDPAYFFSIVYISAISLLKPEIFFKNFRENQFLLLFLALVVVYIIIYTPLYGKSAIGEARKSYFFFLFPITVSYTIKNLIDLRRLLLLFFFVGLVLLVVSISRLIMGFPIRFLTNVDMNLIFLFQVFSILVFCINNSVITNRFIDISVLGLSLAILILRPHRSVTMAAAFGLLLIFFMYRNRLLFLSKFFVSLLAFFTIIVIAILTVPAFEKASMRPLEGIIDPRSDSTASWRMVAWQQQLKKASVQEIFFGKGFGNYFSWNDKKYHQKFTVSPHNGYVQIILQLGLLGLIIYGLLAFTFFRKVIPMRKRLPPGPMRAFLEIGILNFGVAHVYMIGYGFSDGFLGIMLLFYAMGMSAARLFEDYGESVGQLEPKIPCTSLTSTLATFPTIR